MSRANGTGNGRHGTGSAARRGAVRRHVRVILWLCLLVGGVGMLTWLPFLAAALRRRRPALLAWAALYFMVTAVAIALEAVSATAAGFVLITLLTGGTVHALAIPVPAATNGFPQAEQVPQDLLRAHEHARSVALARQIALDDPQRARELGVGRPDLPWAFHGDLVDLNSAPPSVLRTEAGLDDHTVERLIAVREAIGGFSSLADMDLVLDLPNERLLRLREVAVFLPRGLTVFPGVTGPPASWAGAALGSKARRRPALVNRGQQRRV